MATKCFDPIFGRRMRVTRLDNCGRVPAPGTEAAQVVSKGFVSVTMTAESEEGTEVSQKNANGEIQYSKKQPDSLKRFTLEVAFTGVDPDLVEMMSKADIVEDYSGDHIGFVASSGTITNAFAFELWTGLGDESCEEGADDAGGYMLLPFVQGGILSEITVDGENAISFGITGAYTKDGTAWGVGPYNVLMDEDNKPAPLPSPLTNKDHFLALLTSIAPPPEACGATAMPTPPTP